RCRLACYRYPLHRSTVTAKGTGPISEVPHTQPIAVQNQPPTRPLCSHSIRYDFKRASSVPITPWIFHLESSMSLMTQSKVLVRLISVALASIYPLPSSPRPPLHPPCFYLIETQTQNLKKRLQYSRKKLTWIFITVPNIFKNG
ncbi:hypothetical protein J6590_083049, partial [Homalodisca vitripennis]